MWSEGGAKVHAAQAEPTKAQKIAQERLWNTVKDFVDDTSETKEKVPRSPAMKEWGKKLGAIMVRLWKRLTG